VSSTLETPILACTCCRRRGHSIGCMPVLSRVRGDGSISRSTHGYTGSLSAIPTRTYVSDDSRHAGPGSIALGSCRLYGLNADTGAEVRDAFDNFNSRQHIRKPPLQSLHLGCVRFGKRLAYVPTLGKRPMLKISIIEGHTERRLIVEGKLVGPWVGELRSACENVNRDLSGRKLVIDMRHLTAISQEAENVLFELIKKGVKFRCRGVFTKHVLKQVARRASGNPGKAEK
jgi:hypothetical protein